ncbi:hypothetical protein AB0G60_02700 [Streptomyces angustmyceticus]|nr:hypothetical protein [Streptomyces angustmyceticus]UAL65573.1 hypothetical protein K7396_02675 [Streptomyces angustmyceticus]
MHLELIQQLEEIWGKERADHTADDEAWLRAVARLSRETLNTIYDTAYRNEQYAAARCLAWHRAQLR